jgi:hypothetical protein
LFSVRFQKSLPRFAAEIELSHTTGQERIVMRRSTTEPPPNVTPTLNKRKLRVTGQ